MIEYSYVLSVVLISRFDNSWKIETEKEDKALNWRSRKENEAENYFLRLIFLMKRFKLK